MSDSAQNSQVQQSQKSALFRKLRGAFTVEDVVSTTPVPVPTRISVSTPLASAIPLAVQNAASDLSLNPPQPSGGLRQAAKELTFTVERPTVEVAAGIQQVETEKSVEIPPEIEAYLKEVEDHENQLPHEIVIAEEAMRAADQQQHIPQPAIVLPITAKEEKIGEKQDSSFSLRWLVEFSHKIMRMFRGKTVYRSAEAATE